MRRRLLILATPIALVVAYLLWWPTPARPIAWVAPPVVDIIAATTVIIDGAAAERLELGGRRGPESIVDGGDGSLVTGTECGAILRVRRADATVTPVTTTSGRPLGMARYEDGSIIVADAVRGVLRIDVDGTVSELVTAETPIPDGVPIGFADGIAIDREGRILFTDATSRFAPRRYGVAEATFLDLMEHGGHGRLLRLDPRTDEIAVLLAGLHFPNGLALSNDGDKLYVCETGLRRVLRVELNQHGAASVSTLIEHLPGFPDNITAGLEGRLWIGLVAARSPMFDRLAPWPFLRRCITRLPRVLRSGRVDSGWAIALGEDGTVLTELRDATGAFNGITTVVEREDGLFVGTLDAVSIGHLPKSGLTPLSRRPNSRAGTSPAPTGSARRD